MRHPTFSGHPWSVSIYDMQIKYPQWSTPQWKDIKSLGKSPAKKQPRCHALPQRPSDAAMLQMVQTVHGKRMRRDLLGEEFKHVSRGVGVRIRTYDYQTLSGDVIPISYIAPTDLLTFLLLEYPALLVGGVQNQQERSEHLQAFWDGFKLHHGDHRVFSEHPGSLQSVVPLAWHGDEGRGKRRGNTVVVSIELVLASTQFAAEEKAAWIMPMHGSWQYQAEVWTSVQEIFWPYLRPPSHPVDEHARSFFSTALCFVHYSQQCTPWASTSSAFDAEADCHGPSEIVLRRYHSARSTLVFFDRGWKGWPQVVLQNRPRAILSKPRCCPGHPMLSRMPSWLSRLGVGRLEWQAVVGRNKIRAKAVVNTTPNATCALLLGRAGESIQAGFFPPDEGGYPERSGRFRYLLVCEKGVLWRARRYWSQTAGLPPSVQTLV